MINRLGEKHICPAFLHLPSTASFTARLTSASDKTINASLPPSYITDFFKYFPAFSAINEPALEDPVKLTPPTLL